MGEEFFLSAHKNMCKNKGHKKSVILSSTLSDHTAQDICSRLALFPPVSAWPLSSHPSRPCACFPAPCLLGLQATSQGRFLPCASKISEASVHLPSLSTPARPDAHYSQFWLNLTFFTNLQILQLPVFNFTLCLSGKSSY